MKSKTKKIQNINGKTLVVGVDIGKTVHYGYLRAPNGKHVDTRFVFTISEPVLRIFGKRFCNFKNRKVSKIL